MKTTVTNIKCAYCKNVAIKRKSEIDRQLKRGRTKFYCSRQCSGKDNHRHLEKWQKEPLPQGWMKGSSKDEYSPFRQSLRSAKNRGMNIDLTIEGLKELWDKQAGKCAVTGVQMSLERGNDPYQLSLDRIDNSRGYALDNVRWVCYIYNIARGQFSDQQVLKFIREANEKQQPKNRQT